MNKLKKIAIIVSGFFAVFFAMVLYLVLFTTDDGESERPSIYSSPAATFEYADDIGYKLITSEIANLWTFDDLIIEPSEEKFSGDWIYRIVFNPKSVVPNGKEVVVLFGENNLSINGKTYVAAEGVDYTDILEDWAAPKYRYFDYELRQ